MRECKRDDEKGAGGTGVQDQDASKASRALTRAADAFRRVLEKNESDIYAANGIGAVLAERGHLTTAREIFTGVCPHLEVVPDALPCLSALSRAWQKLLTRRLNTMWSILYVVLVCTKTAYGPRPLDAGTCTLWLYQSCDTQLMPERSVVLQDMVGWVRDCIKPLIEANERDIAIQGVGVADGCIKRCS
jgi:hypothetical protein